MVFSVSYDVSSVPYPFSPLPLFPRTKPFPYCPFFTSPFDRPRRTPFCPFFFPDYSSLKASLKTWSTLSLLLLSARLPLKSLCLFKPVFFFWLLLISTSFTVTTNWFMPTSSNCVYRCSAGSRERWYRSFLARCVRLGPRMYQVSRTTFLVVYVHPPLLFSLSPVRSRTKWGKLLLQSEFGLLILHSPHQSTWAIPLGM